MFCGGAFRARGPVRANSRHGRSALNGWNGIQTDITARHRLRPLRRHLSVRRAEMQCERIRKLISCWHRDELGAGAQGSAAEMLESATILGIIRKNAVHASLKGDGRFTGMPRMTQLACIRIRYLTLKASRAGAGSCGGCGRDESGIQYSGQSRCRYGGKSKG